ncbi:hypothetical protein B0T19DRAFT_410356 [Cercophora scortea]|uniref:Uncharacterized protein n=1 Tax=Cercophora scortea TaxID=314031 RepID=A0AAE0J526_9PEZI|nr:hypothetical protein B0T19DRAFT_410356 [Cercophora scortea]
MSTVPVCQLCVLAGRLRFLSGSVRALEWNLGSDPIVPTSSDPPQLTSVAPVPACLLDTVPPKTTPKDSKDACAA